MGLSVQAVTGRLGESSVLARVCCPYGTDLLYSHRLSWRFLCRGGIDMTSTESWVDTKNFPAHRVGRLLRFKLSEVDEWVRSGSDEDAPPEGEGRSTNVN